MKTLLLIDLQNDFLPGGALAVPKGDVVVAVANMLLDRFELVAATQDFHPPDHGSFASQHPGVAVGDSFLLADLPQIAWPDHCVQGTAGAQLSDALQTQTIDHVIQKGTDATIDSYSGFFDNGHRKVTGLHEYLQSKDVNRLSIMGLATDYCVKFTVLDALELGYGVDVIVDGCRGINVNDGDVVAAIMQMRQAGARFQPATLV